jgi:hypothetical protein
MRRVHSPIFRALAFASLAALTAVPAAAAFPKEIAYTLFVDGQRVGYSRMTITEEPTRLVFESKTNVKLGPNVIDLTSKTVADPKTFHVRTFSFQGSKGGMDTAAHVQLTPDSAIGWMQRTSSPERVARSVPHDGSIIVWEDWVMDLEVLLARRLLASGADRSEHQLIFAGSFLPADLVMGLSGESEIQSDDRSVVARRMEVFLFGGSVFYSNLDPQSGIPLYIEFPGTRAEAFRDDFFGDNPSTRYPPRGSTQSSDG